MNMLINRWESKKKIRYMINFEAEQKHSIYMEKLL